MDKNNRKVIIALVAEAMRDSGKTCDDDSWSFVMAEEAIRKLEQLGLLANECLPDKYHRTHTIHEGNCVTCYNNSPEVVTIEILSNTLMLSRQTSRELKYIGDKYPNGLIIKLDAESEK